MAERYSDITKVLEVYPLAWEDKEGTVWISQESSLLPHGDDYAWLENIVGWSWSDTVENIAECKRIAKVLVWHKSHPRLSKTSRFVRRWYGAISLFSRVVGRDWYGRISIHLAWELAKITWLRDG